MARENPEEMRPRATDSMRDFFGSEVGVSHMNLYIAASGGVISLIKASIAYRIEAVVHMCKGPGRKIDGGFHHDFGCRLVQPFAVSCHPDEM